MGRSPQPPGLALRFSVEEILRARAALRASALTAAFVLLLGSASMGRPLVAGAQQTAPDRDEGFVREGDAIVALGGGRAEIFDLGRCVDLALSANAGLEQEREGLAALSAKVTSVRAEGLPRLDLKGNWNRGRDPSFALDTTFSGGEGDGGPGLFDALVGPLYDQFPNLDPPDLSGFSFIPSPQDVPAQTFWRTYLDLYWELHPTRVMRAVSAAATAMRQQESRVSELEHRTAEQAIQAYHRVVLAHERMHAIEAEIASREEFLAVTRRRFRLDFATPLDTLQAAVSLANLRPEMRRRRNELRRAGQDLNVLLGRDPLHPVGVVARFPLEEEEISAEQALRIAARRPDLSAQQLQTRLYELQRGVSKAQNHPYLTLESSYGYVTRTLDELTNEGHDFWRASVTLTVPLFDGRLVHGEVREAEASIRRNEFRVDELRREIRNEVLAALDELEVARIDLAAADLNMKQANDAFVQMSLRYELGKAENLDVLNAQSQRFTARTTLIEARYAVLANTATLKRAMGVAPTLSLAAILQLDPKTESEP